MSSSVFGLQMEKYHGDLNDIVRASAHPLDDSTPEVSWQQQFPSDPLDFSSSSAMFGDPFSAIRDPLLLHELNVIATGPGPGPGPGPGSGSSSTFFSNPNIEDTSNFPAGNNSTVGVLDDMTSPCNIFSRIQISHSSSPLSMPPCDPLAMAVPGGGGGHKAPAVFPSDMINVKGFLNIDKTSSNASVPVQISSPRSLGIKKRKSQAKKVVCIPAPAAANSRSSGEVVPSDLWAWRKYGQKPIKGSPYPRGYYRCSSSKGCSARKQVERSRTDPNMLVITYTSEHNHPWPTQRNALAGSSRSQSSKTNGSKIGSPHPQNNNDSTATASTSVKEEIEMEDHEAEFGEGIPQTYRPAAVLPESDQDNFFADLDEIEIDPLNLLFQGDHEQKENKPLDPFSLFDWSGNNSF